MTDSTADGAPPFAPTNASADTSAGSVHATVAVRPPPYLPPNRLQRRARAAEMRRALRRHARAGGAR